MNKVATLTLEVFESSSKIRILLTDTTSEPHKASSIESAVYVNRDEKRFSLKALGQNISYMIRQRVWPNDTEIYDTVTGPHGTRFCNPHYPNV